MKTRKLTSKDEFLKLDGLVNDKEVNECISEMQKQLKVLAEAVQELAKEVHTNRDFIERQAELSTKTVDVLKSLTTCS